jgi:hypothetical protein
VTMPRHLLGVSQEMPAAMPAEVAS